MNTRLRSVLAFIAGAASATGVTYAIMKQKYDKDMNEEVLKIKEYYKNAYAEDMDNLRKRIALLESVQKASNAKPKAQTKTTETKSKSTKNVKANVDDDEKYEETVKVDYNSISSGKAKEEKPTKVKKVKNADEESGPTIISFEEYTEDRSHEKILYTYLDQEDMIVDENGEPVETAEDEIGTEFKNTTFKENGLYIYIRNDKYGRMYEIVIDILHNYESFLANF